MRRAASRIVVVGAGLAGVQAAEAIRKAGFDGSVLLLGWEKHLPYDRPPLSKQVLAGSATQQSILLRPPSFYEDHEIQLVLGREVVKIDPHHQHVILDDQAELPFSSLLLATGSRLRTVQGLEPGAPAIFYVRQIEDALALRSALQKGGRVAVIGGGVIGLEVAAAAATCGLPVTVIEAAARVMARATVPVVGEYLSAAHAARGVQIRCGVSIQAVEGCGSGRRLWLSDGSAIEADIIVVGVGVAPAAELARDAGLEVTSQGVVADAFGRTSHPRIYAAGEVAYHFSGWSGRHERQEHWRHAAAHGAHVGRAMLSPDAAYGELCSHWTDQFDISLQVAGSLEGELNVIRGAVSSGSFTVFHLKDGIAVGASSVNAPREFRAAKALVRAKARIEPDRLRNVEVDLPRAAA